LRPFICVADTQEDQEKGENFERAYRTGWNHVVKQIHEHFGKKLEELGPPEYRGLYSKTQQIAYGVHFSIWEKELYGYFNSINIYHKRIVRSVLSDVCQRIVGYYNRNGRISKNPPSLSEGSNIKLVDGVVRPPKLIVDEETGENTIEATGCLKIAGLGPKASNRRYDQIKLRYEIPKNCLKNIEHIYKPRKKGDNKGKLVTHFGGYFAKKKDKWIWKPAITVPYELYKPLDVVGTDFNKIDGKYWLTFSKPVPFNGVLDEIILCPRDLQKRIKLYNQLSSEKNAKEDSKQKGKMKYVYDRRVRKRIQEKMNKLEKKILKRLYPILKEVVLYIKDKQWLLSIDEMATGTIGANVGQDWIRKIFIELCENLCVPYFLPPTAYTSKTCPICYHINKEKDDKEKDIDVCKACGHKFITHKVAAEWTAVLGWHGWRKKRIDMKEYIETELCGCC